MDNGELEQLFSKHGRVVDARVVFDRETGRSRGFGFVTMASESDMNDAIGALDGEVSNVQAFHFIKQDARNIGCIIYISAKSLHLL